MRITNTDREESEVRRAMAAQSGKQRGYTRDGHESSLPAPDVLLGILLEDLANLQQAGMEIGIVESQGYMWIRLDPGIRPVYAPETGEVMELCYDDTGKSTGNGTGNAGNADGLCWR